MDLSKNTILITGGSSGIGLELTKQLLDLGNTVIITGRDQKKLDLAKQKFPQIHTIQSDVSSSAEIVKLFNQVTEKFPDLNILINNAGIMRTINLHDTQGGLDNLTNEIEINLNGPIRMVKQFLPHLKQKKSAAIMNVSSGLAFVPLPISPVYCATKAGLHSFTLSLRAQLKNTNVKVFELAPPATQTDLLGSFMRDDMKDISVMKVDKMVAAAIRGLKNDQFEIRPGQSNQLKFMNRLAPEFVLSQLSKTVDGMLASSKH
ncbi:MAG: SDR family oxidoreductase [Pseudobdellovibrionaceae bacterium]